MPESRRLHMLPRWLSAFVGLTLLSVGLQSADESPSTPPKTDSQADKTKRDAVLQALQPIGTLVGEWKGVSQPKRGSNAGAWPEKAAATWKFEDSTSLVLTFESDKLYHTAEFCLADDGKSTQLTLSKRDGDPIVLSRIAAEEDSRDKFVGWKFASSSDDQPQVRFTIRIISDIRCTMLFEERTGEKSAWRRVTEIGMTRAGERLADANAGERQCIVTGGLGTIKVTYEGKTYYVCCEGCKQAFDADPAGTVEAYRERLKEAGNKQSK
jgi:hypothetical protein